MAFASSCLVTDVLNFEKIIVEVLKRTGCRKFARRFYGSQPNIKCLITAYFAAKISIFSILGAAASKSGAFSINAFAILPPRCASLPSSSEKVSKMPGSWFDLHATKDIYPTRPLEFKYYRKRFNLSLFIKK